MHQVKSEISNPSSNERLHQDARKEKQMMNRKSRMYREMHFDSQQCSRRGLSPQASSSPPGRGVSPFCSN